MFGKVPSDPRRNAPRHFVDGLSCELGEVCDLSATGMRIKGSGKPILKKGQNGKVSLSFNGGVLNLDSQVVWFKRRGFRKWEIGLSFLHVSPGMAKAISTIAEFGFLPKETLENAGTNRKKKKMKASLNAPNYYKVLGVLPDASDEEIQQAYRTLARKYHPDVAKDEESSRKFMRISEAYQTLKDEERRALFDLRTAI